MCIRDRGISYFTRGMKGGAKINEAVGVGGASSFWDSIAKVAAAIPFAPVQAGALLYLGGRLMTSMAPSDEGSGSSAAPLSLIHISEPTRPY